MKISQFILIGFIFLFVTKPTVLATSGYVLPYPSEMPGSSFYKIHLVWETIAKYWYFGNFAQLEYNRKLADRYLVEAKTLFEYGQYPLAIKALQKSDLLFQNQQFFINKAMKENKDFSEKNILLKAASQKHIEILKAIKESVPAKVVWNSENSNPEDLELFQIIDNSLVIRGKFDE